MKIFGAAALNTHAWPRLVRVVGLLFLVVTQAGLAQKPADQRSASEPANSTFRADANLALVPFQAVSNENDMITDLRADEIEVREDGIAQKVVSFEGGRIYPRVSNIEIHLLFDCSGSIQTRGLLNPRVFSANLLDEFQHAGIAIWGFSGPKSPQYFTAPTRDLARLNRAIEKVRGMKSGSTPLYRSMLQVARRLSKPSSDSVRMIVVISDGLSNVGPSSADGAIRAAQRAGAALFPVLVNAQASNSSSRPPEVAERVLAFQKAFTSMAEPTGGRSFEFPGEAPGGLLNQILNRISSVIRRDYIVGYSPALVGSGKPHKVQVFLKDKNRGQIVGGVRYVLH